MRFVKLPIEERIRRSWIHLLLPLLLIPIVIATWMGLREIKMQDRAEIAGSLTTILSMTQNGMRIWAGETQAHALAWSESVDVRKATRDLLNTKNRARIQKDRQIISRALEPALQRHGYLGYSVIGPGLEPLASNQGADVGEQVLRHDADTIRSALKGTARVGFPFLMENQSLGKSPAYGGVLPAMLAASPVRDPKSEKVIAALVFVLSPSHEFTRIVWLGRMGDTGETYAFDRGGRLLSQSRFEQQLRSAGLLAPGQKSMLSVEIRDPGGDLLRGFKPDVPRSEQPLTSMAESAVKGNSGINLDGYRDYRGVTVIGAWLWDDVLGLGIATEIDREEAYTLFNTIECLVMMVVMITVAATLLATIILLNLTRALLGRTAALRESVASEKQVRSKLEKYVNRLREAEVKLKRAVTLRDEFLSLASHELKTPLTSLHMQMELIDQASRGRQKEKRLPDKLEKLLRLSQGELNRLNRLINDLLDMSRIESGKLDLNKEVVSLGSITRNTVERMAQQGRAMGYQIQEKIDDVTGYWDPYRIEQIIINLMTNAMKYGQGKPIEVSVSQEGDWAVIRVRDQGIGISQENLARIFNRFERVGTSAKMAAGLGLGLYISRKIAQQHGGSIEVESRLDHGTVFTVRLPRRADMQPKEPVSESWIA